VGSTSSSHVFTQPNAQLCTSEIFPKLKNVGKPECHFQNGVILEFTTALSVLMELL